MASNLLNSLEFRATLRIVVSYLVFATLWILLSDHLLLLLAPNLSRFSQIGTIKGLVFVAISALLLLIVLRAEFRARKAVEADRADLLVREQAARARAESANRAKDELLALVSHELRTPLTAVLTTAEILLQDQELSEDQKELLTGVREGVLQEARIVGDLLDTTSLAAGKLQLKVGRAEVNDIVTTLLRESAGEAKEKSLTIRNELAAGELAARADGRRLEQVFRNLLGNAVKFTPSGGVITVRSLLDSDRVAVEVEDTGIGIAAELQQRLFEPFEQGDRSITRQYGGLGLGLFLARSIIELHRGKLTLHSDGAGHGCRFRVELPAWTAPASSPAPSMPSLLPVTPVMPGRMVLLVEDNVDTLRVMARLLGRMGCTVIPARSAAEAAQAAWQNPISMVISDIGLPDRSGWEMMSQLHQEKGLCGVAISGFNSDEDRQRSVAAGFVAHLVKPVAFADLQLAMEQVPLPGSH